MARTMSFDRQDAVAGARALFWRRGYDSASTGDLEAATGLSRSSIYNTFGSKRGLFDAAIESYLDDVVRPLLAPLQAHPVAPAALDDYLARLAAAIAAQDRRDDVRGCLLLATASSSSPTTRRSGHPSRATAQRSSTQSRAARAPWPFPTRRAHSSQPPSSAPSPWHAWTLDRRWMHSVRPGSPSEPDTKPESSSTERLTSRRDGSTMDSSTIWLTKRSEEP